MDIAELGVRVTQQGVAETTAGINTLAASSEKAEKATLTLTAAEAKRAQQMGFLATMESQYNVVVTSGSATKDASRAMLVAHANALAYDEARTRALALAQIQAIQLDEARTAAMNQATAATVVSTEATRVHGLNLGRVNMELGTATGRILGLNTAMTRFGAMLGGSLSGYPQMIAITAAVVGIGAAYEHFTEEARKAHEEQDKLTASLKAWYDELVNGGKRAQEVVAVQKDLVQQQQKLADLQAKQASPTANRSESVDAALTAQIAATQKLIDADKRMIAAGATDVQKTQSDAFDQQQQQHGSSLAELLQFNADDEKIRQQALAQLKIDQALETQYLKAGMVDRAALYAQMVTQLQKAIDPRDKLNLPSLAQADPEKQEIVNGLLKQLDALRKVNEEENVANVQREYEIKLVGTAGFARDVLVAQEKAEIEAIKAHNTLSGIALEFRLKTIQADEDAEIAKAKLVRTLKEELDTRTMLNDIVKDVTAIGKRNEATGKAENDAAAKRIKDAQDYQDSLEKIARNGIERIVTNGTKSYQNFFDDLLKMFSQLMDEMEKEAKKHNTAPGAGYQALGIASSAIGGGIAGYQIGQSTGSGALGALGGGLAGFELGNAILPGIGGAVGALAGAAAGMFGAAEAHKKAAAALEKAAEQVHLSLLQMNAQAGTGTALDSNIAQAKAQADQLFNAIDAALPGLANQVEREKEMAQVRADEAIIIQQLIDADKKAREQFDGDMQARLLAAQGDVAGAAAIRQRLANQKELDDATKQFGATSQQVTELLAVQAAEAVALAKAQADANKNMQDDLAVRKLVAEGHTAEADALRLAIAQQREYDDAVKAGMDATTLATLKDVQALEAQKAANDAAAAATERYTASMANLTAQFLALTGQADAAATATLAEQQRQQTNAAITAGATPDELALLGLVQLFQRGQLTAQQQAKAQTDILNAQLKTAQDALSVAQNQLQAARQAADSLKSFRQSLDIGPLAGGSPLSQLNAARAQRDKLFAAAQGGDTTAAGQYGSAAQSFLQLSQGYNASGLGYQNDLAATKTQADALSAQYDHQVSLAQQTVDALTAQIKLLQEQIAALQDANNIAKATKDAVIAELERMRDAALAPNGAMIDQLNALRDTLTGVGRDIVTGERDILVGDQNNLNAATQAEIDAIKNGASLQQITQLEQIRQLDLQKTAQDDYYARQLADNLRIYGPDSSQVQEIIALQQKYDQGVQDQINAINGNAMVISTAIGRIHLGGTDTGTPSGGVGSSGGFGGAGGLGDEGHGGDNGSGGGGDGVTLGPDMSYDYDASSNMLFDPYLNASFSSRSQAATFTDELGNFWDGRTWHRVGAFALGGDFAGGLMRVGEQGQELVATGPARIHTAKDLNADTVAALQQVVARQDATIAVLQSGMRQLIAAQEKTADSVTDNTRETRRGLEAVRVAVA